MSTKNFRHVRKVSVVKRSDGERIKVGSYRPDKRNPNDKVFQSRQFSANNLPPKVDLRPYMTEVENQGDSNSCTANAMAGAYEYLMKRLTNQDSNVSRLFIYYNARALDGDTDQDEGTYLRSCIKVLKKYGTCSEQTWPFDLHRIHIAPEESAYSEATNFLVEDAYRVEVDLDQMRSCLAEGYPFTFGLQLFGSFQDAGSQGLVPMPDLDEDEHDGGHAMLCVGYSDADKVFIVRNSWGESWGDRGYCYIPYNYMTNPDLNGDLWSIRRVSDNQVDLSQDIHGTEASLFDSVTAAIAAAIQVPGAIRTILGYENKSISGYEFKFVYSEGKGYISIEEHDDPDSLYYQEYEYEEDLDEEYSELSEDVETDSFEENGDEIKDSHEEELDFEETEDIDEDLDSLQEDETDSEEIEDSYEEADDEDLEESEFDEESESDEETEDSDEESDDEDVEESEFDEESEDVYEDDEDVEESESEELEEDEDIYEEESSDESEDCDEEEYIEEEYSEETED
jgi:hypothetical protein